MLLDTKPKYGSCNEIYLGEVEGSAQWFSKWEELPLGGDFDGQGCEKNKGGDRGEKQHKRNENARSQSIIELTSVACYNDVSVSCRC